MNPVSVLGAIATAMVFMLVTALPARVQVENLCSTPTPMLEAVGDATPGATPVSPALASPLTSLEASPVASPEASLLASPEAIPMASPVASTCAINIVDFDYVPRIVEISAGTTIVWTNRGAERHTVTSPRSSFNSHQLRPGRRWDEKFVAPGRYEYFCQNHSNMSGVVLVR
jgi:plastocyanin